MEESSVKKSSVKESRVEESTGAKYSRKRPQKLKIIARNTAGQVGVFLHLFFVLQVGWVDAAQSKIRYKK